MLKSLDIQGYRGVRTGKIPGLSHVNVFIGPNGCGKSTVLEAIQLLAHSLGPDSLGKERWQLIAERRNQQGAFSPTTWYQREGPAKFVVAGSIDSQAVRLTWTRNAQCVLEPQGLAHGGHGPITDYLRGVLFLDAGRALDTGVEHKLWEQAFLSGAHGVLKQTFEKVYGLKVGAFTFTADQRLLVEVEPHPLRLDDLGTGMRIAFRVLLAALVSRCSALLLEEFDAYQYKTSLTRLAAALCEIAEKRKVQLFLTTHSLESVEAFLKASESRVDDWIKVFPLALSPEGELSTRGMGRTDAHALLAAGLDLRDLPSPVG